MSKAPLDFDSFWAQATNGGLRFPVCDECGYVRWPPAGVCPECLSRRWTWRQSDGIGTIWSFVVYHRAYRASYRDRIPYNVIFVELEEGVRLVSRAVDCGPDDLRIGLRVRAVSRRLDGEGPAVPVFVLDPGAQREG